MTRKSLFLAAIVVPLLTMGAGCSTQNPDDQTSTSTYNTPSSTAVASSTDGNDELAIVDSIEPGVEVVQTKSGASTSVTLSYAATLKLYSESGYRFQIVKCSGVPGSLYLKKGKKFMIDNRDNKIHQIGIGTKKYQLAAYGFAVVSVPKVGSFQITCDGGGAAHVWIEN